MRWLACRSRSSRHIRRRQLGFADWLRLVVGLLALGIIGAGFGRRFVVVLRHDNDFERVVERAEGYAIVEKEGKAGRVAEQTDPHK